MNVFAVSMIATPIAGAFGGGMAAKAGHTMPLALGIVLGLVVGVAVLLCSFTASYLLVRTFCISSEKLNRFQWLGSLAAVLVPAIAPVFSGALAHFVVLRL